MRQRPLQRWSAHGLTAASILLFSITFLNADNSADSRILIKFTDNSTAERRQAISEASGLTLLHQFDNGLFLFGTSKTVNREAVLRALDDLAAVEFAESDRLMRSGAVRSVPSAEPTEQWWHMNNRPGSEDVDMDSTQAWSLRSNASNIIVAVLGSGIALNHEDLRQNVYTNIKEIPNNGIDDDENGLVDDVHGFNFVNGNSDVTDESGHGTAIAGLIGAKGNNRKGIDGVCWSVQLLPVKITDEEGRVSLSAAMRGFEYAQRQGATVILGNWNGTVSRSLDKLISQAAKKAVVVMPAGDRRQQLVTTTNAANVIRVAASDSMDRLGGASNYGMGVHLAAPGHEVFSTSKAGYVRVSGSPLAAAQVAGAAALLQAHGVTSPEEVRRRLMDSSERPVQLKGKVESGRLNLFNALYDSTPLKLLAESSKENRYAGHAIVPGELLVNFKKKVSPARQNEICNELGITAESNPFGNVFNVKLPAGMPVHAAIRKLNDIPELSFSEPNYVLGKSANVPNDARFSSLYAMNNTGQTGGTDDADIDAVEAWDLSNSAANIVVAVIDTGVDHDHQDLAGNMWTNNGEVAGNGVDDDGNGFVDDVHGYDFVNSDGDPDDDDAHGSHCSGTIGAVGNNGVGVAGVCWDVQIMALKFLDSSGGGSLEDALSSVSYATANGASVMSNSWGGGGFSQSMFNAITAAHNKGILFVAAAGNSSNDNDNSPEYPAGYNVPNVISVAASDHNDALADFSSFGDESVHLAAPGVNTLSTTPNDGYSSFSGTSMACPHVSGACALLMGQNSGKSHTEIKQILMDTADDKPSLANTTISGGRLNIFNALSSLGSFLQPPGSLTATAVSSSVIELAWSDNSEDETGFRIERHSVGGKFALLSTTAANATSFSDSTVSAGETYTYRVQAFNADAGSGFSNETSIFVGTGISGTVTQGGSGLSGVAVNVQESGTLIPPQSASPALALNDNSTVSDSITVSGTGSIRSMTVSVNLNHAWIGALKVSIVHPDGTEVLLHNLTGSNGQSINTTYPTQTSPAQSLSALNGKGVSGSWTLRVEDTDGFGDTGTFHSWGFTLDHLTSETTTTGSDGSYSVGGLTSGTYTVTPSKTGLTFSPTSATVTVGPDAEDIDFAVDATSPDLVITEVIANPNQVIAGENSIVSVTVKNSGPGDADASTVSVRLNGTEIQSVAIGALSAGSEVGFNVQISNLAESPDPHSVVVVADSGNVLTELDETNNQGTVSIDVLGKPDLVIDVLNAAPATVPTNGSTTIRFTVKNVGESAATDSTAGLYIGGQFVGEFATGTISAGESSGTKTFLLEGVTQTLTVLARADESDAVDESNESNNEKSLTVSIGSADGPDAVVVDATAYRLTKKKKGKVIKLRKVRVSAFVANAGNERFNTWGWVTFSIVDADGNVLASRSRKVGRLQPNRSRFIRTTIATPSSMPEDAYRMVVIADVTNRIVEADESNNEGEVVFDY